MYFSAHVQLDILVKLVAAPTVIQLAVQMMECVKLTRKMAALFVIANLVIQDQHV